MGLYEGIKDAIGIAQKADNIELYRQLLDLGNQALDMQAEIARLKEENESLRKANDLESRIIRHNLKEVEAYGHSEYPYITLSNDPENIRYCAICWGKTHDLIQLKDEFNCIECYIRKSKS